MTLVAGKLTVVKKQPETLHKYLNNRYNRG